MVMVLCGKSGVFLFLDRVEVYPLLSENFWFRTSLFKVCEHCDSISVNIKAWICQKNFCSQYKLTKLWTVISQTACNICRSSNVIIKKNKMTLLNFGLLIQKSLVCSLKTLIFVWCVLVLTSGYEISYPLSITIHT